MTETVKEHKVTAMTLLMKKPTRSIDGAYICKFESCELKVTKKTAREYFELTFRISDGPDKNNAIYINSGRSLKKGTSPEYNTKLFNIVTVLLGREPNYEESINLNDLIGSTCKIVVFGDKTSVVGIEEVTEFEQLELIEKQHEEEVAKSK